MGSDPAVANCTFIINAANEYGGALYNSSSSNPTLSDCIFSGNMADQGGGMYNRSSSNPAVTRCTFSGNMANDDGGGGIHHRSKNNAPTLADCILWSNCDGRGSGESAQIFGGSPTVTYSCVQGLDELTGDGNIGDDPVFVRSPDAGPDGVWGTDDDDYGDLRLTAGSPAIDAGDPDVVLEPGVTDLDGHARVLCGRVDMGAYEFGIGDFNCDASIDLDDYAS